MMNDNSVLYNPTALSLDGQGGQAGAHLVVGLEHPVPLVDPLPGITHRLLPLTHPRPFGEAARANQDRGQTRASLREHGVIPELDDKVGVQDRVIFNRELKRLVNSQRKGVSDDTGFTLLSNLHFVEHVNLKDLMSFFKNSILKRFK